MALLATGITDLRFSTPLSTTVSYIIQQYMTFLQEFTISACHINKAEAAEHQGQIALTIIKSSVNFKSH